MHVCLNSCHQKQFFESPDICQTHQQPETERDDTNPDMTQYYDLDQHRVSSTPSPVGTVSGTASPTVWQVGNQMESVLPCLSLTMCLTLTIKVTNQQDIWFKVQTCDADVWLRRVAQTCCA